MFGMGPQNFLKKAANNKPPETNEVSNPNRPKTSTNVDTTSETGKVNAQGTQKDLQNNKEANIGDAKVDKNKLSKSQESDVNLGKDEPGFFAELKETIKNSIKKKAMDGMTSVMEGAKPEDGGRDKQNAETPNAPKENRPGQQEIPKQDKTRPKPRVPNSEVGGITPNSKNTPADVGVPIYKPNNPGKGFKMPKSNVPKMPKFR